MTRFARAKGSKASNEKAPEDSTPWEVMKEQLLQAKKESEEAKKRQQAEQQRIENYENFLKERRVQKKPVTWCDFPEEPSSEKNKKIVQEPKKKNKHTVSKPRNDYPMKEDVEESNRADITKKKKKKNKQNQTYNESNNDVSEHLETASKKKNKRKSDNKEDHNDNIANEASQTNTETTDISEPPKKKKKKNKQKAGQVQEPQAPNNNNEELNGKELQNKKKKKNAAAIAGSNVNNEGNVLPNGSIKGYRNKNDNPNDMINYTNNSDQANNTSFASNKKADQTKKKLKDGQPVRRKEINDRAFQLIINGKEVELVRFDGFPIMKRDAERLAELKNSMINKGIPKSEVQRTMKLERRRAEKALARVRKEVCYNCRKGGHNLSDCPELRSKIPGSDAPEGVCFKCGSTEHRQFECKVQRDKEFRFATCFICKEPGHIARQCPDNPKGMYPNGGCCKLCGDVTHLRKDCPTANTQKEETSVKLQTLESTDNIEDIGVQNKATVISDSAKKPKKIKF